MNHLDQAISHAQQWHAQQRRLAFTCLIDAITYNKAERDEIDLDDAIREVCDGFFIYTREIEIFIMMSDFSDEIREECGGEIDDQEVARLVLEREIRDRWADDEILDAAFGPEDY